MNNFRKQLERELRWSEGLGKRENSRVTAKMVLYQNFFGQKLFDEGCFGTKYSVFCIIAACIV